MHTHSTHQHPDRRSATVEAFLALAAEHNPSDITAAVIAERMGVSRCALFKRFPGKDAILLAVMGWIAEALLSRVDRAVQRAGSASSALEGMFMAHVDFAVQHPAAPRMLFDELHKREGSPRKRTAQTLLRRYRERLQLLIDLGKHRGEFRSGLDSAAAATLFVGAVQGLILHAGLDGGAQRMRAEAPGVFAVVRLAIEGGE
ncbi:MAG: TetR/AcrR family transcriptional regulator [Pseudomonadota bacterium]